MPISIALHITGIVQGVGFRPHVFRLAHELQLGGTIRNDADGVFIRLKGSQHQVDQFLLRLKESPPPLARIDSFDSFADDGSNLDEHAFMIEESRSQGDAQVVVSPDKSMCPDCLADIRNPNDRHFNYPFTNCTNCGPRYTLIKALPYDRKHTSMAHFKMCPDCESEYKNPLDRRYHAQPVSCPNCGPVLMLKSPNGEILNRNPQGCLADTVRLLRDGAIFAIKGLGGFHLVCDATNPDAVAKLRERKHRPAKPFAVMVKDLDMARRCADGCEAEWQLLESRERPIVVLKKPAFTSPLADSVAPGIDRIGLFLPYTPLHALLLDDLDCPLVATSANRSGEPIIIDAAEIHTKLADVVDYILDHNRPIVSGCDDSVVQWCAGQLQVIRMARGYAPMALHTPTPLNHQMMAVGPQQKNTLAFGFGHNLFLSPHIGDLFSIEAETYFTRTIDSFRRLYDVMPRKLICDKHPDYAPSRFAREFVQQQLVSGEVSKSQEQEATAELTTVQHHFAHVLSVMAVNNRTEPVLGFSFDGTGLGDDGSLWGGEVMLCQANGFERIGGLAPFPLPGADKASHEPWRVVIALLRNRLSIAELHALPCLSHLSDMALANHIKVVSRPDCLKSSSMGRLFDAAASLLGLCNHIQFEGQAGMLLEAASARARNARPLAEVSDPEMSAWQFELKEITHSQEDSYSRWDGSGLLEDLYRKFESEKSESATENQLTRDRLAAGFIDAISRAVVATACRLPDVPIVLSGGVFQSRTLSDLTHKALTDLNRQILPWGQVPVNDGGIALGQLWYGAHRFK